jgi:hypothetical protein
VPLLVPRRQLGRANGMVQFAIAASRVVSPPLAALLLAGIGLRGIVLVDFATFAVAIATLLPLTIPRPPVAEAAAGGRRGLLHEAADGLRYIVVRRGLLGLLLFFALVNLAIGFGTALLTPLVLSFASTQALGLVTGLGGVGLVAGSVLMSAWGGPRRRIHGVLVAGMVLGLAFVAGGSRPLVALIAAAMFTALFCASVANASNAAIWQSLVPPQLQGRVFGSLRTIAFASFPAAYIVAGPLADRVFEPLLAPGGALTGSVGLVIGSGPGRGIAFLLMLVGLLPVLAGVAGYLARPVRHVEDGEVAAAGAAPGGG